MLLNPFPYKYIPIPGSFNTARQFKYVLLNPSSHKIGEVAISALFYADDYSFFLQQSNGECFIGIIDFDINSAGLLDAIEMYSITLFPELISCSPPTPII